MLIFLYWSVTWYINHTPVQATFSGIVIQHKMNLMVFLYICFTLFCLFCLFVCFTGLCCIFVCFFDLILIFLYFIYLGGFLVFLFSFWSFRKSRKEWEHEDRWSGRSEGSGRTWERKQTWAKYLYIYILI